MNGRARMLTALAGGVPDRVPVFDWIDEKVVRGLADLMGIEDPGQRAGKATRKGDESLDTLELYCRIIEALDLDASWLVFSTGLAPVRPDFGYDKYGRGFMLSDHGIPAIMEGNVKGWSDIGKVDMAAQLDEADFAGARYVIERLGPSRAHVMSLNGPFQESWYIRGGMDKTLLDYCVDPELVHATARIATDFNKRVMDLSAEIGCDIVVFDGDLSGNEHMLMSHDHFLEFVAPYKREMVDHAHGLGLKAVKHSDGFAWPFLADLVEIGFDGFHPIQPQCMEIGETKSFLGGEVCLFGNIDCLDLLVFGEPEQVTAAVEETIERAAPGGAYVLCSSNSIHPGCKPENALAMFEAAKAYGDYARIEAAPHAPLPVVDAVPSHAAQRDRRRNRRRARSPSPTAA